jgi:hypothetical protein
MPLPLREKTGRNDSCPCGSGKKYKHCCLTAADSADIPWRQQRDASGRLAQEMLRFTRENFAGDILEAWVDFNQDESPLPIEEDGAEGQIFMPYLFFDWDPERRFRTRSGKPRMGLVARSFLLKKGKDLAELEHRILNQAISQPLSFYEVVRADPGQGLLLRDVLIGGETEVIERTASHSLRPGDLIYSQMCRLPEVVTLGRMAPMSIPPGKKVPIIKLRAKLRKRCAKRNLELTAADLIRYREEIRTAYLDIRDRMRTPPFLTNTDGDPFLSHTLTFHVGSAHAAFEALAPLAWGTSKEELLESAKLDRDGALLSVEIPWLKKGNRMHKGWENTILGQIRISGQSLIVDVNSVKRATKIRQEIDRRLGILAVHQNTVTNDPNETVEKRGRNGIPRRPVSEAEFSPGPELDEEIQAELQRLVENWIFEEVPALGGRTPSEAVGDADGREIVESLLSQWERHNETITGPGAFRPDINAIRRLLKLAPYVS